MPGVKRRVKNAVLATPEISKFRLNPAADRFVLLACDGLFNVVAVDALVRQLVQAGGQDRTGQERAGQDGREHDSKDSTGEHRAGQDGRGQAWTGQHRRAENGTGQEGQEEMRESECGERGDCGGL